MRFWAFVLTAVFAVMVAMGTRPAVAAPLEVYGRLPLIEEADLSPDGSMIAFVVTDGEKRFVLVRRIGQDNPVARVEAADRKVRDIAWAGDRWLIVSTSRTAAVEGLIGPRREHLFAMVFDLQTGKSWPLMKDAMSSMNTILAPPQIRTVDGQVTAIVEATYFADRRGRRALFRVRLSDGATALHERGTLDSNDWIVGADGRGAAFTEYDDRAERWRLNLRDGDSWKPALELSGSIDWPDMLGLGRDGRSVLVATTERNDREQLEELTPAGRTVVPTEPTVESLITDPRTFALLGTRSLVGDEDRYNFFDPKDAAVWRGVQNAFPGDRVRLVSWSDDRRRILVIADSPKDGPASGMVDLNTKAAEWLGGAYANLRAGDVSEVRPVSFKAADGLTITGYLTLPKGRDAKALPLVVLPHGGPASRDRPGFDWWSQALASRGYAVLRVNFRGSDGFGQAFLRAGYGQWGRKMQTDLSDGVRDLVAQGVVDPARVCIVGASYGGYAALAGAAYEPGVYRCAASVAGVSDLKRMLQGSSSLSTRYWTRFMGVEKDDDAGLTALSPAAAADRIAIPVLLVHGADDTVVPIEQSKVMADALKKAGKPVEFVTLEGEDHWLSRGATRLRMLTALVDFLETHNPPT